MPLTRYSTRTKPWTIFIMEFLHNSKDENGEYKWHDLEHVVQLGIAHVPVGYAARVALDRRPHLRDRMDADPERFLASVASAQRYVVIKNLRPSAGNNRRIEFRQVNGTRQIRYYDQGERHGSRQD